MARAKLSVSLVLAGLLVSCGGGSSPTAPDPVPDSLAGSWQGEMSGSAGGAAFTCSLRMDLNDAGGGVFDGGWRAECPGATVAGPAVGVTFAGISILNGLPSLAATPGHPLGTCGWAAPVTLQGNELEGTWVVPEECEDPSLAGGPLRLRFDG